VSQNIILKFGDSIDRSKRSLKCDFLRNV